MKNEILFTVILVIFVMFFTCTGEAAEPVLLKLSSIVPANATPIAKAFKPWTEKVMHDSEGTLEIKIYAGGILGRNPKIYFQQLEKGVFDMAFIYPTYFGGRFPELEVFSVPFMLDTYLEGSLAAQRMFDRGLFPYFDDVEVLGLFTTSAYYIYATFPINRPEDLKGHKFRSGDKFQTDILKTLGVTAVNMSFTKCAETLSTKLIDGTFLSPLGAKSFGVADVARHQVEISMGGVPFLFAMNKRKYESLPSKAKAAIDKNRGEVFARIWGEGNDQVDKKIWEALKKDPKHNVVVPKGKEIEAWEAAIQPAIDSWVEQDAAKRKKLLSAFRKELDRIRSGK